MKKEWLDIDFSKVVENYDKIFKYEYQVIFFIESTWIDIILLRYPSLKHIKQKINLQIFCIDFPKQKF